MHSRFKLRIMKTTEKIASKELISENVTKSIEHYSHVSDIINRTYVAMGRNKSYEVTNVSTNDVELKYNVGSTAN